MNYASLTSYAYKANDLKAKSTRANTGKGNQSALQVRRKNSALRDNLSDAYEARGVFTCTSDMSPYTTAAIFSDMDKSTRITMKFGVATVTRRGINKSRARQDFDIRFQTSNGDCDLGDSNILVQLGCEQITFVSARQNCSSSAESSQMRAQWDTWSQTTEAIYFATRLYSDIGIYTNYRFMDAFSDNIYLLTNSNNERFYVKWVLRSRQGEQFMRIAQAEGGARKNTALGRSDQSQSIGRGKKSRWRLMAQIVSESEALAWSHDPMDGTQVWDSLDYPLREVGEISLDAMCQGAAQDELGDQFSAFNAVGASALALPATLVGEAKGRSEIRQQQVTYVKMGSFYRQLNDQERCYLITNMARSLSNASLSVQKVIVAHLRCASLDFGYRMAAELELIAQFNAAPQDAANRDMRLLRLAENGLTLAQSRYV